MKRVLITFATREGQTAKVAKRIFEALSAADLSVQLFDASDRTHDVDLDSYDLLIFGASMHAGGLESEIVDFINRNKDRISGKNRSFFLVLLSAATKDAGLRQQWLADARRRMKKQLAVNFPDCEMVAGALAYSKYSVPVRWVMKRIAKQAGEDTDTSKDYEYTDWDRVDLYAQRLLEVLRSA